MDIYTSDQIESLIAAKKQFCASIFIPTYRAGADAQQNRICFKKCIGQVKLLLIQKGWKSVEADDFLTPLRSLLNDELFWQHPTEGLAFFLNEDLFLFNWMPIHFQEQVMVGERFFIRPLLPFLNDTHKFYVLAISENRLRFLKGSILDVQELSVKTIPKSLMDAIRFNDPERQLQLHTQTPRIPGERAAAMFHGHGVGIDDEKDDLREYCRQVDRGLHQILKEEDAPLVIAGVEALFSTYAKTNTYPHLVEEPIVGNPELLSNSELRKRAWKILESRFAGETKELLTKYIDLAGTNLVSDNIEEILKAAGHGKIQYLLVNSDQPWWGRYSEDSGSVESHDFPEPDDTEVVNLAMIESLRTGSKVYEIKPRSTAYPSLLAIYRY